MSGHVQTKHMSDRGEEACHVWRFMRRCYVNWSGEIKTAWPEVAPDPHDVILLVKFHLSDPG